MELTKLRDRRLEGDVAIQVEEQEVVNQLDQMPENAFASNSVNELFQSLLRWICLPTTGGDYHLIMLIQKPIIKSKLVPFTPATIDHLWNCKSGSFTISGVSFDGSFGWVAKGAALEVFSVHDAQRLAAWHFGEGSCVINDITEFGKDRTARKLVIGTSSCLICLFDVNVSVVVKAVRLPFIASENNDHCLNEVEVDNSSSSVIVGVSLCKLHREKASIFAAVETISFGATDWTVTGILSQHLSFFNGIVAVGTTYGHVYLLDMCLDNNHISSVVRPNNVDMLDPTMPVTVARRSQALARHYHLCLELGEYSLPMEDDQFHYRKPNGEVSYSCDPSLVSVSCMKFIKYTGYLVVGFNFGCFQLWKLSIPVLEFSSRYEDGLMAAVKFAYQEPENDPKHYGYLWVTRGPLLFEPINRGTSYITLYQLGFSSKIWINNFGYLLEDLVGVWIRFEHDLHASPYVALDDVGLGSRLFACYTLENHRYRPPQALPENDQSLDESYSPDLNLCIFVWEAVSTNANECFLAVFDMNRWYNAQIPNVVRDSAGPYDMCSYWAVWSLDTVIAATSPDSLLAIHVGYETLCRFKASVMSTSDQLCKYLQPSSLSFTVKGICESGFIVMECPGIQRQVLSEIQSSGSALLLNVNEVYAACVSFGLIPGPVVRTVSDKREAVLQMAIEHSMIGFITSCISHWSTVEFTSEGCTMRMLLDWAWSVVTQVKETIDKNCEQLYDWSNELLSDENLQIMRHSQITLCHLKTIFKCFGDQSSGTTELGRQELSDRLIVVQMISDYLDAVMWFYDHGFLPEHSEDDSEAEFGYAFPYTKLSAGYSKSRIEISNASRIKKSDDKLFIDNLLANDAPDMMDLFEDKCLNKFYPPSSFQAVVNVFLLTGVTASVKHFVTLYVIRDLISVAENESLRQRLEEHCTQYCRSFRVSMSVSKYVKAIWMLDHGFYEEASVALRDTSLYREISDWQFMAIVTAFLSRGHQKKALTFMTLKNEQTLTLQDIGLRLQVLIANGLTAEALEYQRSCHMRSTGKKLMSVMIEASYNAHSIGQLLELSFTPEEERHLVDLLRNSNIPVSQDLLVLYYLQHSKIVDAIHASTRVSTSQGVPSQFEGATRLLVEGYKQTLPAVQRKLISQHDEVRVCRTVHREYDRPVPLSATLLRDGKSNVITRSRLLRTVLDKINELKPSNASTSEQSKSERGCESEKNSILFGTPIVPPSAGRRRSHLVSQDVIFPSRSDLASISAPIVTPLRRLIDSCVSSKQSALLLLRTPPVVRKSSTHLRESGSRVDTLPCPQSILSARHKGMKASAIKSATRLTWHDATIFSPDFAGKPLANSTVRYLDTFDDVTAVPTAKSAKRPRFVDDAVTTDLFYVSAAESAGAKSKLEFTEITCDVDENDSWLHGTSVSGVGGAGSGTVWSTCAPVTLADEQARDQTIRLKDDDGVMHVEVDEEIAFKNLATVLADNADLSNVNTEAQTHSIDQEVSFIEQSSLSNESIELCKESISSAKFREPVVDFVPISSASYTNGTAPLHQVQMKINEEPCYGETAVSVVSDFTLPVSSITQLTDAEVEPNIYHTTALQRPPMWSSLELYKREFQITAASSEEAIESSGEHLELSDRESSIVGTPETDVEAVEGEQLLVDNSETAVEDEQLPVDTPVTAVKVVEEELLPVDIPVTVVEEKLFCVDTPETAVEEQFSSVVMDDSSDVEVSAEADNEQPVNEVRNQGISGSLLVSTNAKSLNHEESVGDLNSTTSLRCVVPPYTITPFPCIVDTKNSVSGVFVPCHQRIELHSDSEKQARDDVRIEPESQRHQEQLPTFESSLAATSEQNAIDTSIETQYVHDEFKDVSSEKRSPEDKVLVEEFSGIIEPMPEHDLLTPPKISRTDMPESLLEEMLDKNNGAMTPRRLSLRLQSKEKTVGDVAEIKEFSLSKLHTSRKRTPSECSVEAVGVNLMDDVNNAGCTTPTRRLRKSEAHVAKHMEKDEVQEGPEHQFMVSKQLSSRKRTPSECSVEAVGVNLMDDVNNAGSTTPTRRLRKSEAHVAKHMEKDEVQEGPEHQFMVSKQLSSRKRTPSECSVEAVGVNLMDDVNNAGSTTPTRRLRKSEAHVAKHMEKDEVQEGPEHQFMVSKQLSSRKRTPSECSVEAVGVNLMDDVNNAGSTTPTRRLRKSEAHVSKQMENDEELGRLELQLTPRRSTRLACKSENEMEISVLSPARTKRQYTKKKTNEEIQQSPESNSNVTETQSIPANAAKAVRSLAALSPSRRRSHSSSLVPQREADAGATLDSGATAAVEVVKPAPNESVDARPVSDNQSELNFSERISFVFSAPRLPSGKPENESVAAIQQSAVHESVPFVFSPPVHRTRARSSNQSVNNDVDLLASDALPQTKKIDKPVARKSKRVKKDHDVQEHVILLTPPTPAPDSASVSSRVHNQSTKRTRTSNTKNLRW